MVATNVLMKTWFERCTIANIREVKSVYGLDEDAPDERPIIFNPKMDMANPPVELVAKTTTPEAFRKKMAKMATIDEDAARWFDDKPLSQWSRKWDLTRIPCPNAIATIWAKVEETVDYIDECYSVKTYLRCYELTIFPCNGKKLWPDTKKLGPTPPKYGRKNRRAKTIRRKLVDELQQAKKNRAFRMSRADV
ncbi:hypothetical protein ACH5RR_029599 [Cinchona calisaya]|uniref:Uncharacterized protein n=1 Tax=Cinchona calisaya TaxID=153742 RepID=A0ABD2YXC7_9GENT